jgi:hypothetical protein
MIERRRPCPFAFQGKSRRWRCFARAHQRANRRSHEQIFRRWIFRACDDSAGRLRVSHRMRGSPRFEDHAARRGQRARRLCERRPGGAAGGKATAPLSSAAQGSPPLVLCGPLRRNSLIPQPLRRMPIDAVVRPPYGPPPLRVFPNSGHRRSAKIITKAIARFDLVRRVFVSPSLQLVSVQLVSVQFASVRLASVQIASAQPASRTSSSRQVLRCRSLILSLRTRSCRH